MPSALLLRRQLVSPLYSLFATTEMVGIQFLVMLTSMFGLDRQRFFYKVKLLLKFVLMLYGSQTHLTDYGKETDHCNFSIFFNPSCFCLQSWCYVCRVIVILKCTFDTDYLLLVCAGSILMLFTQCCIHWMISFFTLFIWWQLKFRYCLKVDL